MKRLKKFNEINYNLSNIDLVNENLNISKYQFQLRKLMKQLNIDLYYVERHKLSIFAFYPLVDQLIKTKNSDKKYTIQDILLIIICGINILSYENKDKSQKLINIAVKNDIPESVLDYTIDIIKKVKGLFIIISEKFGKDITKFIDMLSYTDLFVPFMNVLNSLVEYDSINFDSIDVNSNDMKFKLLINKIMKKLEFIISSTDKFQNKENIKPLLVNDELKSPMFRKEKVIITESLKDKMKGKSDEELSDLIKNLNLSDILYSLSDAYQNIPPIEFVHKIADKFGIPKTLNKITIMDILKAMNYIQKSEQSEIKIEDRKSAIQFYKSGNIEGKHTYITRINLGRGYLAEWCNIRVLPEEEKELHDYLEEMLKNNKNDDN